MRQAADERTTLLQFLDEHRDILRRKCAGLTAEQLDTPLPPSDMTLGGMMKHLAYVESWWISAVLRGQPQGMPWDAVDWAADEDWDWHSARDDSPEAVRTLYEREVARADAVIAGADLEELAVLTSERSGERANLRWILVHLIEEYARHCGHADLIRELIDGATGT